MPRRALSGLALLAFAAEAWAYGNATATGAGAGAPSAVLFEHGRWRCKTTRHGIMAYSRGREDLVSESLDMLGEYSESEAHDNTVFLFLFRNKQSLAQYPFRANIYASYQHRRCSSLKSNASIDYQSTQPLS